MILNPGNIIQFDIYRWVDYVELLALFSVDGLISKSDIRLRIDREDDIDINAEAIDTPTEGEDIAEIDDRLGNRIEDYFRHVESRMAVFNDFYPFKFDGDNKVINVENPLTEKHKIYLFLLFSANLRYFTAHTSTITSSFEIFCAEVLKEYLGNNSKVLRFGVGPRMIGEDARYGAGNLFSRIEKLTSDLHLQLLANKDSFSNTDNGDGGLDIVAWIPINDENDGFITIFGQCACTDEWKSKQHSSNKERWGQYIHFTYAYTNIVFIPHLFRKASGTWHVPEERRMSVLFDRLRLITHLPSDYTGFPALPAAQAVEKILAIRSGDGQ